jgi:hypothetical protein
MAIFPTERSLNPVIESRVIVNTASARAAVGFGDFALGTRINGDTANTNNEIFFRKTAAGTTWQTVTRSAGGVETINATTFTTAVFRTLRIEINDLAGKVFFYIDGTLVATHTTNIPTNTIRIGPWVGVTASAAAVSTMDLDYIRVWSDDPVTPATPQVINSTPTIDLETLRGTDLLPNSVWNSRSVLQDLNYVYNKASSGAIEKDVTETTDDMTIDDYASYTANTIKRSFEKLSGKFIDTSLSVRDLCLDGTCISSGQLLSILSGTSSTTQNYYNTNNIVQQITGTGTQISIEDQSILDNITGTINSIIVQVQSTFSEIVTFLKSVTFKSTVVFEDRVTFSDTDMAGTATIVAGAKSVHITFDRAYSVVPKITATSDGFVNYRIISKSTNGFVIETQVPVTETTSFDWMAIAIKNSNSSIGNAIIVTPEESSPIVNQVVSGEELTPTNDVVEEEIPTTASGTAIEENTQNEEIESGTVEVETTTTENTETTEDTTSEITPEEEIVTENTEITTTENTETATENIN